MRDLIRRDKERRDQEAFERLKAELSHAFATPESAYHPPLDRRRRDRTQPGLTAWPGF
jgi:hypothetical protein